MNYGIKFDISTIVTALYAWLSYYVFLPAMNLASPGFWWYFICIGIVYTVCLGISAGYDEVFIPPVITGCITALILIIWIIGYIVGTPLSNPIAHQTRLTVETTTFENEIKEVDWNRVPQIDKASSSILGNRKMGTLTNEVSQYNVMDNYTQIIMEEDPLGFPLLDMQDFLNI